MSRKPLLILLILLLWLSVPIRLNAQKNYPNYPGEAARTGMRDAGGIRPPTASLERGRVIFVQSSCHFCHGADLTVTAMGAANLIHSAMVGADVDGNIIGPLVRAGLPALQTSMPSYADLTDQQVQDLARYIHYLRQQGKYNELMHAQLPSGNEAAGESFFSDDGKCTQCHTAQNIQSQISHLPPEQARETLLMPTIAVHKEGVEISKASQAHSKFTENVTLQQLANILSFLRSAK